MTTDATTDEQEAAEPLDQLLAYGKLNGFKLDWVQKRETWGQQVHADMEHGGLRLQNVLEGPFGEVPEVSDNETGRPRGALRRADAPRVGSYRVKSKADIWMQNAAAIYEEALTRQWSSATDIPWTTLTALPDDIEQAECELATFLSDVEFVAGDVPGRWISDASPDFFEPRMFLVSQIMDEARHLDVFRKRALSNGGGLMQQSRAFAGGFGSTIDNARDFTEMSVRLHISGEGLILTVFRMGERMAYNDAEKAIYRLCASDESRHVAFGVMHLRYLSEVDPARKEEIHCLLDDVEAGLVIGEGSSALAQAGRSGNSLAVLLGGGEDRIDEGEELARAMRQRQIKEYIQRVKVSGFGERFENGRSGPVLMKYVEA